MQRPQSVPRLNTAKLRKVNNFKYPDLPQNTFNESSRFKARNEAERCVILRGPSRDYGQQARPRTADSVKNFYSNYHSQKKAPKVWEKKSKYILGYTGHIHGRHHIEGLNTVKATNAALKRKYSEGDNVKINRRIHLGKRSKTPENPGQRFHIKGYSGFLRGSQHIAGRTFKRTTQMALTRGVRELCSTSPIPNDPQANRRVENEILTSASPVRNYTGHLNGTRQIHGKTFLETYKSQRNFHAFTAVSRKRKQNKLKNERFWTKNYPIKNRHQKYISS